MRTLQYLSQVLICKRLDDLPALGQALHLALGVFDGLHLGHQALIREALAAATANGGLGGVLTFDPHPIRVCAPAKAPSSLLETLDHKAHILRNLGVLLLVPLHFDAAMAAMEPEDFIQKLLQAPVRTVVVGEDWRFGHDRRGDVHLLRRILHGHACDLIAVPPVMWEGERISSTRIRQAIRDGNLDAAAQMLGRPFTVSGRVVHGQQLGRTLGFPTANLNTGDCQLPPNGVWAVEVQNAHNHKFHAVANLGVRPTVGAAARSLEVHLLDFSGDLYQQRLEVQFIERLRPELKFPSLDALRTQIAVDVQAARQVLMAHCSNA